MKSEVERVIGNGAFALDANIGRQRLGQTEKQQRVVNEMRRKIKKDTAAGPGALAPSAGPKLRSKAIIVRFQANDAPQRTARNEFADRLKIAVIAAILVNGEQPALLLRKRNERNGLVESCREGLVHEHMASRRETFAGDWIMGIVWRGDDDQPDFWIGEQFVQSADDRHIGILRGGLVAAALENCGQAQSGNSADHRRVKRAAGKSKSDETNADHRSIQESVIKAYQRSAHKHIPARPFLLSHR